MAKRHLYRGGLVAMLLALAPALAEACNDHQAPQVQARSYLPVGGLGVFSVFGARTLEAGQFSVGLGYLGDEAVCQQTAGYADFNTFFLPLAYGVTDRLMVGVDIPYSRQESDRSHADERGLDDINVGITYRLLDEGVGRPALGVVGFAALPTADKDKGLGTEKLDAGFKLILSKSLLPRLVGHVNVGYTFVGESSEFKRRNEVTGGVGVEYAITPRLSALAEVVGNTNREDGRKPNGDQIRQSDLQAVGRAGFRYIFNDWLTGSIGVSGGLTHDSPDRGAFALLTVIWPPRRAAVAPTSAPTPPGGAVPGALAPGPGALAPGAGAPGAGAPGAGAPGAGVPGAGVPGAGVQRHPQAGEQERRALYRRAGPDPRLRRAGGRLGE
ncbi:MAG: transporter, partial [Candidatus Rokubacteria bacterium]|nr:transporter [Candidatus Rokubacteria bacterium]